MELVKFSSWPEVMAYAKSGRPLYYQAPMDHHATRFLPGSKQTFAYSAQGRTIRLWPGGSVGRGRSRTHDPFNADSKHLDRFSHPAEQRVESSGVMREGHRVMSTELARRYPLGWTMAKHLMDWSYRRKGAIETISASKIRKQGYNVEQVRAALKDNETFENFDGNVYSGSDGSGGMWRVEITDENEKSTVARERQNRIVHTFPSAHDHTPILKREEHRMRERAGSRTISERRPSPPITRVVVRKLGNGWVMKAYDSEGHLRSGITAPSSLVYVKRKSEEWFPGVPIEYEEPAAPSTGKTRRPKANGSARQR